MATLTISLTGSAVVTGTKNYTVNDADIQSLLNWAKVAFAPSLPANPTNAQVLQAWIQNFIDGTKQAVQLFQTPAPVVPAPISII